MTWIRATTARSLGNAHYAQGGGEMYKRHPANLHHGHVTVERGARVYTQLLYIAASLGGDRDGTLTLEACAAQMKLGSFGQATVVTTERFTPG
jgi:hypothetical protein